MTARWLADARMADSTRAMRKSIVDRDILPAFQNRLLNEITTDDLRALCNKVKARGAPATAVHVRDIVKQVYAFAILHGEKVDNPADDVGAASIATFVPKGHPHSAALSTGTDTFSGISVGTCVRPSIQASTMSAHSCSMWRRWSAYSALL